MATWEVLYPEGIIEYNDMFRRKLFPYDQHLGILLPEFEAADVRRVLEMGCGTGPYLTRLAGKGFECVGIDQSAESLSIARSRAEKAGLAIEYYESDARSYRSSVEYDAILAMYLPVPIETLAKLIETASRALRHGGLFCFMYLVELENAPKNGSTLILDVAEEADTRVARLSPWTKEDLLLEWSPVLIVQRGTRVHVIVDHDKLDLLEYPCKRLAHCLSSWGFDVVTTRELRESTSAPPWTLEILTIARKMR